jgi:hypothetical protein
LPASHLDQVTWIMRHWGRFSLSTSFLLTTIAPTAPQSSSSSSGAGKIGPLAVIVIMINEHYPKFLPKMK